MKTIPIFCFILFIFTAPKEIPADQILTGSFNGQIISASGTVIEVNSENSENLEYVFVLFLICLIISGIITIMMDYPPGRYDI